MPTATRSVLALVVLGAAMATVTVDAKNHDSLGAHYSVEAFDAGGYYFRIEGLEGRNPDIRVAPGSTVLLEVRNVAHEFHNIHIGDPVNARTELLQPGENALLEFRIPADATGEAQYWCDPHRGVGMIGTLVFDPDAKPGAEASIPALPGVLVVAACALTAAGVVPVKRP